MDEAFGAHCLPTHLTRKRWKDADLKRFRASLRLTCKTFKTVFDSNNLILKLKTIPEEEGWSVHQHQLTVVHATPRISSLSKHSYICEEEAEISDLLSAMQQPFALRTLFLSGRSLGTLDLPPLLACSGLKMLDIRETKVSDLSPLAALGGSLEGLRLYDCKVEDRTPSSA
jgi:Leucine-rich repeat (LRR) protein